MTKYWYVVQNEENEKQKEYLVGFLYGNPDTSEEELIEYVQKYCREKKYRLSLLIQVIPMVLIVNQIYPFEMTGESAMCLEYALQTIMEKEGVKHGLQL